MTFYRFISEVYLLMAALVSPTLCIFGWLLLGKAQGKRLTSHTRWLMPLSIAASLGAGAILLELYCTFYDPQDYALRSVFYLLILTSLPFHVVSFVRLWKTISALPAAPGDLPVRETAELDEGVWPPQPRREA